VTLVVGVDAGASHTEALLAADLTPVARRRGGPGALTPAGLDQAARTIIDLVTGLVRHAGGGRPVDAMVVGAAGAGTEASRARLEAALLAARVASRVQVTTDAHLTLQSAFGEEPGIVLAAGTGSIGLARDPRGVLRRAGGHGWRCGDEGSGYALGRAGIAAVGKAADRRGPPTALSERLPRASGTADATALLAWAREADVAVIAGLATAVLEASEAGDATAASLVAAAAGDLAMHVHALLAYFPPGHGASVAFSGSLLDQTSAMRRAVLAALEPDAGRILVTTAMVDPAAGAVALAAQLAA